MHHPVSRLRTLQYSRVRVTSVAIVGLAGLVSSCTPYYARGTVRGEYRTSAVVTVAEPQPVYVESPRVVVVARAPEPVYVTPPPRVVVVAPAAPGVVVTAPPPPPVVVVRPPSPPSVTVTPPGLSVRVHEDRGRHRGRGPE